MGFSNAPTSVALVPYVDYFYWPCISGESFPPTFSGTSTYFAMTRYPCVKMPGGVTGVGVAWPAVPLYGGRSTTFPGYTITFSFFMIGVAGTSWQFQDNFVSFSATTVDANTISVSGSAFGPLTIACTSAAWHSFTMSISSSGLLSLTIDSIIVAQNIGLGTPSSTIQPVLRNNGGNAIDVYITNLRVSWP